LSAGYEPRTRPETRPWGQDGTEHPELNFGAEIWMKKKLNHETLQRDDVEGEEGGEWCQCGEHETLTMTTKFFFIT
jgi:hypothetical protein